MSAPAAEMSDEAFEAFLEGSIAFYNGRQAAVRARGVADAARWGQDGDVLTFFDAADRPLLIARVVEIGRYDAAASAWQWGWSQDAVPAAQREATQTLRAVAEETGLEIFARAGPFTVADEDMAWHLTAIAVQRLNALGAWRAPDGDISTFLAITALSPPP